MTASAVRLAFKRVVFRSLERLSIWRSGTTAMPAPARSGDRSVWLFVSTIGELNAIAPFLSKLLATMGQPSITLISDRQTYDDAYRARFPGAAVVELDGSTSAVLELIRRRPPLMLLVAEIPCLLHDAPCRFSFAIVDAVKRSGAPVVLVNGWLYGYKPPSRLDRIENWLFKTHYVQAFDLMAVQTDAVRDTLIAAGAAPQLVVVAGNIKFDALRHQATPSSPLTNVLGARARKAASPVVVGGSVTETKDQAALVSAFVALKATHPDALLVLAPRHPDDEPRMAALRTLLDASGLDWRLRSRCEDAASACAGDVLVLDTMGELQACYAAGTIAFVGTDHNVLEPLAFGKPVFVFEPGCWERTYPSYPVYQQLLDKGVIHAVPTNPPAIAATWLSHLQQPELDAATRIDCLDPMLVQAQGAVDRTLMAMHKLRLLEPAAP